MEGTNGSRDVNHMKNATESAESTEWEAASFRETCFYDDGPKEEVSLGVDSVGPAAIVSRLFSATVAHAQHAPNSQIEQPMRVLPSNLFLIRFGYVQRLETRNHFVETSDLMWVVAAG